MCNLKKELREKIDKLERNFAVSNVIFKKYQPIFVDLFRDPAQDPPKVARSRKSKRPPCTPGELFDFCWTLFIRVKAAFPSISDDLVNSYHLLLATCDYVYSNAMMDKRDDLLNPGFDGGEGEGGDRERVAPPCILDKLCTMHDGIINEVKSIREHWWKPDIKKCFESKLLHGDKQSMMGVLDCNVFETNSKNIRKDYETYVLSIGEYDERVFLGEEANEEIGTPTKMLGQADKELGQQIIGRRNLHTQFSSGSLIPCTPLSGRHYLRAREQAMVTPVSTATYLVSRLNKMVAGRKAEPSQNLTNLVNSLSNTAMADITSRVETLGKVFTERYTAPTDTHPGSHTSFANMRLRMGSVLYFRVLEKILVGEQRIGKSIAGLLEQAVFHQALFTACLEVVIFSYNSLRTFPWSLETFQLEPLHFYKVIEILIRAEDGLARDVVKHLQRIEEQILESRAWARSSPVWDAIAACGDQGVPSCEEVSLPAGDQGHLPVGQSPLSHHKAGLVTNSSQSPIVGDRFKSPIVTAVARRQLFSGGQPGQSILSAGHQSLLATTSPQHSPMKSGLYLPSSPLSHHSPMKPQPVLASSQALPTTQPTKPRRTGSLALFLRKVYHLAHLRLENLCQSLQLPEEIVRRIWTCLEWTLRTHHTIMRDRHLDQVIMCALYIVCKVSGKECEKNFTDIMKHYRNQPQAASHVYRSVLLKPSAGAVGRENTAPPTTCPPTPGRMAASSTVGHDGEERGDLIMFYNTVYLSLVQEFALRFSVKKSGLECTLPPLSPLPQLRANPSSPCRKVSDSHSVFIRPLKPTNAVSISQSPIKPLSYSFSRSPAKDLAAINEMMRNQGSRRVGKRLLQDEEETTSKRVMLDDTERLHTTNSKIQLLLGDREGAVRQ
eukprot:GFUD01024287.1.p1 GENE.GFUD01024287.1~~GFUD01024287.1.p1  ORF type:complete len:1025 (-),score=334.13 GFUD01024287.1:159-2831(-)